MKVRPREPNCWPIRRAAPTAEEVDDGGLGFSLVWWGLVGEEDGLEDIEVVGGFEVRDVENGRLMLLNGTLHFYFGSLSGSIPRK